MRQNNAQPSPAMKTHRAFSMVLVVLIGAIMVAVAFAQAKIIIRAMQNRGLATDYTNVSYTVEQVFSCVKYWIDRDVMYFTNADRVNPLVGWDEQVCDNPADPTDCVTVHHSLPAPNCGSGPLDFTDGNTANGYYVENLATGHATSTFTVGSVTAQIERQLSERQSFFNGVIGIYGHIGAAGTTRDAERYIRYKYKKGIEDVDVMFVIDRSGSIAGTRQPLPTAQWASLVVSLTDSLAFLNTLGADLHIGVVSFGSGFNKVYPATTDMGRKVADVAGRCPIADASCVVVPDIPLTRLSNATIDPGDGPLPSNNGTYGTVADDLLFGMKTKGTSPDGWTNMSQGLLIAGTALQGKYYPYGATTANFDTDFGPFVWSNPADAQTYRGGVSGTIENTIFSLYDRTALPTAVADGILSSPLFSATESNGGLWDVTDTDDGDGDRDDTINADIIVLITDGAPNYVPAGMDPVGVPIPGDYINTIYNSSNCSDVENVVESAPIRVSDLDLNSGYGGANLGAKCNVTIIADTLKAQGIKIAVIGVGAGIDGDAAKWLLERVSSGTFIKAGSYDQVGQAILKVFGEFVVFDDR